MFEPGRDLPNPRGIQNMRKVLRQTTVDHVAEELVGREVGREEVERAQSGRPERSQSGANRVAEFVVLSIG